MTNGTQPDKLTGLTLILAGTISAVFCASSRPSLSIQITYAIMFGMFTGIICQIFFLPQSWDCSHTRIIVNQPAHP